MLIPGDPFEQRKRQLIAKLSGRGGRSGGGFRVGRPSGSGFGRGLAFGSAGGQGQRTSALPQMLGQYGGNQEYGAGAIEAPQFDLLRDGGSFGYGPVSSPGAPGAQPMINPLILRQLLGNYGLQGPGARAY